jgi:hypothetical protein
MTMMTTMTNSSLRRSILRANSVYLGVAAVVSFFALDLRAILLHSGPESIILGTSTTAAIGFVEAHGLAFILAVLFWRAEPALSWHVTAAATSGLLGICNLSFWEGFVVSDSVPMGIVATGLHLGFATTQVVLAATAPHDRTMKRGVSGVTTRPA